MLQEVRAFWITQPGRGEIRTEPLETPGTDDVVVRTVYSGVSRGTEALVFTGRVPPSEWARMRAPFQDGEFPAPVKYGYANVGIVEQGPPALAGRHVFSLFPHQTRFVVPARAVSPLPEEVPPSRAVLAANLETAVNGLWDARPHVGDRITVIGAGTVGCLVAWLAARTADCDVELVDINPRRETAARALGIRFREPAQARGDADIVLHTSGAPEGLQLALELAAFEADIVELSWYGDKRADVLLGGAFHARRLTIRSSQVGTLPPAQRSRWDHRRRMQFALQLLTHAELDALITGESAFDDLPAVMAQLATTPGDTLCHRIRY